VLICRITAGFRTCTHPPSKPTRALASSLRRPRCPGGRRLPAARAADQV